MPGQVEEMESEGIESEQSVLEAMKHRLERQGTRMRVQVKRVPPATLHRAEKPVVIVRDEANTKAASVGEECDSGNNRKQQGRLEQLRGQHPGAASRIGVRSRRSLSRSCGVDLRHQRRLYSGRRRQLDMSGARTVIVGAEGTA